MRLISVLTEPDGKEPRWEDAEILNTGIGVIPRFKVQLQDERLDPVDAPIIHMTLVFNYSAGRYTTSFVGLDAVFDITGTDLREIRVAECLRLAASAGIYVKLDKDDPPAPIRDWWGEEEVSFVDSDLGAMVKSAGPVEWVLQQVALVYGIAQISSQSPAKAVEKAFGLPARTAARWIAKAKEQGILKRASVPGWEHLVDASDSIRDQLVRGVPLVSQLPDEAFKRGEGDDGEHTEAP